MTGGHSPRQDECECSIWSLSGAGANSLTTESPRRTTVNPQETMQETPAKRSSGLPVAPVA